MVLKTIDDGIVHVFYMYFTRCEGCSTGSGVSLSHVNVYEKHKLTVAVSTRLMYPMLHE